NV
ncbi:sterol-sensing domain of SREBP cleavage-activation family protein, partial [Vibrio parahaemolyticus SBR10290]